MDIIDDFLNQIHNCEKTIYCIGDAMLDEYHEVKVDRISPEWPVPVMKSNGNRPLQVPGGVINVAHQYKHFNVKSNLISFTNIENIENVLCKNDIDSTGTFCVRKFNKKGLIPVKQRFIENGIQVAPRLDIEEPFYGLSSKELDATCQNHFNQIKDWPNPDVAIFSDYDKGFFSGYIDNIDSARRWIMRFRDSGKMYRDSKTITIVDPKKGPVERWAGCKVFKPNAKEAEELTGSSSPVVQTTLLAGMLPGSQIVITRGSEGVAGWDGSNYFSYKSDRKVKVESVVGAGDCFVAILGLALSHGYELQQAVEIAYRAGEVYVKNRLNRPITPAEMSVKKLVRPEDLASRDFKLVFTNGVLDLLHKGHISTLDFAKSKGEKLVVALNSDESVKKLKGPDRPVNKLEQRIDTVSRLDMVDFVMFFEEDTPLELIKKCKPDVLVKASDYKVENIVGADIVPETYVAPYLEGFSTTAIVDKMRQQQ